MTQCKFVSMDGGWRCGVCGRTVKMALPKPPIASCGPQPGLGDMVASGLAAIGITKDLAQAAASAFGIKDCGCAGRQEALNRIGERLGFPPGQPG